MANFNFVHIRHLKNHFKKCWVLFIPVISYSIYRVMDKIMLGFMCTKNQLGYYENAERILTIPILIISAMGTGNKLDPTKFEIADINKTSVCPLARVMRLELKKRGIEKQTVLFSTEEAKKCALDSENGRHAPGSISFVPSVAGLIAAGEAIKKLISL